MTNIAELPTKDTIRLIINKKNPDKVTYVFKNRYGNKIGEYENRSPATLSPQSNVARQYKQLMGPKGKEPKNINSQFLELKQFPSVEKSIFPLLNCFAYCCQQLLGHICVDLFLGFLFHSIHPCVCLSPSVLHCFE